MSPNKMKISPDLFFALLIINFMTENLVVSKGFGRNLQQRLSINKKERYFFIFKSSVKRKAAYFHLRGSG